MAESISAQYQNKNDKKRQKCLQQLNQMVLLQLKKIVLKFTNKNYTKEQKGGNKRIRINLEKIANNKENKNT